MVTSSEKVEVHLEEVEEVEVTDVAAVVIAAGVEVDTAAHLAEAEEAEEVVQSGSQQVPMPSPSQSVLSAVS